MNQPLAAQPTPLIPHQEAFVRRSYDQLQTALSIGLIATWSWDIGSDKVYGDQNLWRLFGLSDTKELEGLLLSTFIDTIHPDDQLRVSQLIKDAMQSGHIYEAEYRIVDQHQKIRWVLTRGQAFFNEEGVAHKFIGTVIDITESKRSEAILHQRVAEQTRNLEQQANHLRTTLDASINSIIAMRAIRDATGTVIDFMMDTANQAIIRSNFMTPDQIIGRTLLTVFPGNTENGFFDLYARVVDTGKSEQSTQYYHDEHGLEGWFEVSAVKQGDDGVVVTFNNITERKQAELVAQQQALELRSAKAELKRSNENLQQFAHIASHDLQEPLRRIQVFSDLLKTQFADNLSDGESDMIRRIQRSAQRMQLLIKDLLMYSKLSTQREPFTTIALADVLDDVVSDLEVVIAEKNAIVDVADLPRVWEVRRDCGSFFKT